MGTTLPISLPNPIIAVSGDLLGYAAKVLAQANAMAAQGNVADTKNLWPMQLLGKADRKILAGTSKIESGYHSTLGAGHFLDKHVGDAMSAIEKWKLDTEEKILIRLHLNRLAVDGQLSQKPRAVKYIADGIQFINEVQKCMTDALALVAALQANVAVLLATEQRMLNMIQANINAVTNLLNQICNWGLPSLASLAALLGALFHWNGFNFNSITGFKFNPNLFGLNFSNFSFKQCVKRNSDFSSFFGTVNNTVNSDTLTLNAVPVTPTNGTFGDPSQFSDPSYIATMQATTTPVLNPQAVLPIVTTSLPVAAAIISNYSLPPAVYVSNIVSAVTVLQSLVIQPGAAPPVNVQAQLAMFVNLSQIVASGYDPNLTAAWLIYLDLNRTGRSGQWISAFESVYQSLITPSVTYLNQTPVLWNQVLGSTLPTDAPTAIPLIATLEAATTQNLLWRLSYIEASLLGYPREVQWDAAADAVYTSSFTGEDTDYASTSIAATGGVIDTITLGVGTATYPVAAAYPAEIANILTEVIALATINIANTPSYQSSRPQFRFTYDVFAQATLVDRYSQFWRDFNANLIALLAQDPYIVSYVVSYTATLNGAVNPLADATAYNQIDADAMSRNRTWVPGSILLNIPTALVNSSSYPDPTDQNDGWTGGIFNAPAFLSRPDVQAQTLPVQIAMLRTNQSYASLLTTQTAVQGAVQDALTQAAASMASIAIGGWGVETNADIAVPAGATGLIIAFSQIDFDQTGYVQDPETFVTPLANTFIVTANIAWDTGGDPGTRTVNLLKNGVVFATASSGISGDPFTVQISTILEANAGDTMSIQALHSLSTSQTLLSGSSFVGLVDTSGPSTSTTILPSASGLTGSAFTSGIAFPILSVVSTGPDGNIYPINTVSQIVGQVPFIDGIALAASTAPAESINVATVYGAIFNTTNTNWVTGGLLYAAADGTLTQDYVTLTTTVRWIVCVGRAVTPTSFIYEPHIPTNYTQVF